MIFLCSSDYSGVTASASFGPGLVQGRFYTVRIWTVIQSPQIAEAVSTSPAETVFVTSKFVQRNPRAVHQFYSFVSPADIIQKVDFICVLNRLYLITL